MLASNTPTAAPGDLHRSVMVRGVVITGKQMLAYAEKHGLCPRCAETVVRKRNSFWSNWEPVTEQDPRTGDYQVYKGYCIQPKCYTLDQAKRELGEVTSDSSARQQQQRRRRRHQQQQQQRRPKAPVDIPKGPDTISPGLMIRPIVYDDDDDGYEEEAKHLATGQVEILGGFAQRGDFHNFLLELDLHHLTTNVAKEGFQLFRNAVVESHKSNPDSYLFASDTWVKHIRTALVAKTTDEETAVQGLLLIMSCAGVSPSYRRDILQYPTVRAILSIQDTFQHNLDMESLCCATLEVLFNDNQDTEWRLSADDGEQLIKALITVMNTRQNYDSALRALFNLSQQNHFQLNNGIPIVDRVNEALAANHGVQVLSASLQGDGPAVLVAEAALHLLWRLSLPSKNADDDETFQSVYGVLPTEEFIQTLLHCMARYESSPLAQVACCGVLSNLVLPFNSTSSTMTQYPPALGKKAVEGIARCLSSFLDLSSRRELKTVQMVHLNGILAIHNLLCNPVLTSTVLSEATVLSSLLVTSMNLLSDNPAIQELGCVALSRLCGLGEDSEQPKRAVIATGGIDAVSVCFRNFVKRKSTEDTNARNIFNGACTMASSLFMLPDARSEVIQSGLLRDIEQVFLRDPSIASDPLAQFVWTHVTVMNKGSDCDALINNIVGQSCTVELAESCFSALASAALEDEKYFERFLSYRGGHGIECLLDAMERFLTSAMVQQEGITILGHVYYTFPFTGVLGNAIRIGPLSVRTHTEREIDVIRSAMRHHRSNVGMQEKGFWAFSNFLSPICVTPNDLGTISTIFASSFRDVHEAIAINQSAPSLYKSVLHFFWTLTFVSRGDEMQIWALRIAQKVFDCMSLHPDDEELQLIACDTLLRLLDDERMLELASKMDEFESIFRCISLPNEDVVERACEIVASLLSNSFPASNQVLEIEDSVEQLIWCLETYVASEEIQMHLCSILNSLVTQQDHFVKQMIAESGGLNSILESAVKHRHNQILLEDALLTMAGVARTPQEALDVITPIRKRLGSFALRVIEDNTDNPVLEGATLILLWVLCGQDDYFKKLISESNSIPQIIDVMNQYLFDPELQKAGCTLLWILGSYGHNKLMIGRSGGIRSIVNAMNAHTEDTALQKEALTALKNLSSEQKNNGSIVQYGAEDAVIRVLWINIAFPVVLVEGFAALNNIAVDSVTRTVSPMQEVTLVLILQAMRRFEANANVLKNALFLLKSYTYSEENLFLMASHHADDLVILLAAAAERFPTDCHDHAFYIMRKIERMVLN